MPADERKQVPRRASATARRSTSETADIGPLPWRLDGMRVIVRPHKGHGLAWRDPVKHSQTGKDRAGPTPTAAAGNLDTLADGALMDLSHRAGGVGVVGRQPPVTPTNPPRRPRHRRRRLRLRIEAKLGCGASRSAVSQAATAYQPSGREPYDSRRCGIPTDHLPKVALAKSVVVPSAPASGIATGAARWPFPRAKRTSRRGNRDACADRRPVTRGGRRQSSIVWLDPSDLRQPGRCALGSEPCLEPLRAD